MFVLIENNLITEIAVAMDTVEVETLDEPSTPRAPSSPSIEHKCKEQLKPTVGMVHSQMWRDFTNRMHAIMVSVFKLVITKREMRKYSRARGGQAAREGRKGRNI
jgi:hypothetical protein